MKFKKLAFSILLIFFVFPLMAVAENSTKIPGYTIHHNATTTDFLPPEVARMYHIQRSLNRGMINISIIKDSADGKSLGAPVAGYVRVYSANLSGQTRNIPVREIREGMAIYYIGDFHVSNNETMNFAIEVRPEGETKATTARMSQTFVTR